FDTVSHRRQETLNIGPVPADYGGELAVKRPKGLKIALGMARRNAHIHRSGRRNRNRTATCQQLARLAELGKPHVVRVFLAPLESTLVAINPKLEAILLAYGHLARPEHTLGSALEAQHDVDI